MGNSSVKKKLYPLVNSNIAMDNRHFGCFFFNNSFNGHFQQQTGSLPEENMNKPTEIPQKSHRNPESHGHPMETMRKHTIFPRSNSPISHSAPEVLKFLGTLVPQIIGVKLRLAFAATCHLLKGPGIQRLELYTSQDT